MNKYITWGAGLMAMAMSGAHAATPDNGTLTLDSGTIVFSEGPNFGANPTIDVEALGGPAHSCVDVLLPCDSFALTVDLPDDLVSVFPGATIRMLFTADDPNGTGAEDYDVYLFDAEGNKINESVNAGVPEAMVEFADGGVTEFRIEVGYYTALGSTYTGEVTLELGEPAEGADVDAFFDNNSVARALIHGDESRGGESSYVQRRSAGGALGGILLALFAAVALRRRAAR